VNNFKIKTTFYCSALYNATSVKQTSLP